MRELLLLVLICCSYSLRLQGQEINPDFKPDIFTLLGYGSDVYVQPGDKLLLMGNFTHIGKRTCFFCRLRGKFTPDFLRYAYAL